MTAFCDLLKRINSVIAHRWHLICIHIMPNWKLKEILRTTPFMDVRIKIWKAIGNVYGEDAYINRNVTLIDSTDLQCNVVLGARSTFSPNVTFITSAGPNNSILKDVDDVQRFIKKAPIAIGEDTWIGAGVTILPGITIGKRCVIGACSLVTHDIPDDYLAYGAPCKLVRKIENDC